MVLSYGSTFILNSTSISRQQFSAATSYSSTSAYTLDAVIQMSADSNTPFAFAIYLANTGSPTNLTFSLATGPSRGEPVVGSGCRLLWFGWSAFSLSVANPLVLSIPLEEGISGSYELWVAAQNVTSPSVAGYLGVGANVVSNPRTGIDLRSLLGSPLPSSSIPVITNIGEYLSVDLTYVNGGIQTSGLVSVDISKLKGTTIAGTSGVLQVSSNISSVTSTDKLPVAIWDGAGGLGKASVSVGGVLSTTGGGGGGGLTPVYLTDSTGTKEVKISQHGSLAIVGGT